MIKNIVLNLAYYFVAFFHMLLDLLNPLFYSSARRLNRKIDGKLKFNSKFTVVFVLYQKNHIPFYVQNVLDVFKELQVNCILSVNEDADQSLVDKLKDNCNTLFVRKNFGLDFAAYKDSILQSDFSDCERLIIMNDSIFLFKNGLKKLLLQFLEDKYDVVALGENISAPRWHLQSYLVSFSKKVIQDKDFIGFWKDYKPFTHKKYVIYNGEVALSNLALKKYYKSTKVIFNLDVIINNYKKIEELAPKLISNNMFSIYQKELSENSKGKELQKDPSILNFLEKTNITHSAAFLFKEFSDGSMILKRDIVFKKSFNINEVYHNLNQLNIDIGEKEQVINELKLRGNLSHQGIVDKFLFAIGIK